MSESSAVANGLAGAGGGIIAQIITYPLQTVNTRQQTERTLKRNKQSLLLHSSNTTTVPAPGTFLQILQVIGTEGWGGLYSGLKPSLLGTAASQVRVPFLKAIGMERSKFSELELRGTKLPEIDSVEISGEVDWYSAWMIG